MYYLIDNQYNKYISCKSYLFISLSSGSPSWKYRIFSMICKFQYNFIIDGLPFLFWGLQALPNNPDTFSMLQCKEFSNGAHNPILHSYW